MIGTGGGSYPAYMFWKLAIFAVGSFVFSWIFWKTHKLVHKGK